MRTIGHWIGGKELPGSSGRSGPVFDPATGRQHAEVAYAGEDEAHQAVAAAAGAFRAWSQASLSARSKVLFAFRELVNTHARELAELTADEHG